MGYMKKMWRCVHGCQVMEYHTKKRHPPGEKRQARQNPTPEKKKDANQRAKAMHAQRLILNNFDPGDKYITLTYTDGGAPPDMEGCRKDLEQLFRYLRPRYRKEGGELKWIRNIERTKRGIYHIHILVNNLPGHDMGSEIRRWWKARHGAIAKVQDTYLDGGFGKLAGYLTKTQRDEDGTRQSSYSHSRNLVDPAPEKKEYIRWSARSRGEWKGVRVPKGYELVPESLYEGIDERTGFPYRYYTLIRDGT